MADDAYTFIKALGIDRIDAFSFSLGGMIAQDLALKHPDLVRKLVFTGTGPRGGKDMDNVLGTTYRDILRVTLTRSDPKEFLFFNRNTTGKPAAKAFIKRLQERTVNRDQPIRTRAFQTQLKQSRSSAAPPRQTCQSSYTPPSSPTATTTAWCHPSSPKTCTDASRDPN
jgi:pimeloyl-ACP methyl ester carboxylesterase